MEDFASVVFFIIFVIIIIANVVKKAGGAMVNKVSDSLDQFQSQVHSWNSDAAQSGARNTTDYVTRHSRRRQKNQRRPRRVKHQDDDSRHVQHVASDDDFYSRYKGDIARAKSDLLREHSTPEHLLDLGQKVDWLMGRAISGSKQEQFYARLLRAIQGRHKQQVHHEMHHSQSLKLLEKPLNRKNLVQGIIIGEILKRKHFNVNH